MRFTRGVSTVMAALAVVVAAVIVGGGVYAVTAGSATTKTSTSTSTLTEMLTTVSGSVSTITQTNTATSTLTSTATSTATSTLTNTQTSTSISTSTKTNTATTTVTTSTIVGVPEDLVQACAAEGNQVTLYDSFTTAANAIVIQDWNKDFPQITMTATPGLTAATVNQMALTQFQAGKVQTDVVSNALASLMELNASGVLQSYNNYQEAIEGYPPGYTIAPGLIHPSTEDIDLLAYNTKLVTNTANLPTSIQGLEQSQWNGKIAIDNPSTASVSPEYFATFEPSMGNATWTSVMKGIAANNPILTTAASASLSDLESGQAELAVVLLSAYNTAVAAGNPIAVVPGFYGQAHVTGISLAADAPQPACGELLVQWWTSYSGQEMIVQTGRGAQLPSVREINATQIIGYLPPATTVEPPSNVPTSYYTDATGWQGYYGTIFG
jgi:ABC-type Fe3+ transport system substrate-binding protein